MNCEHSETGWCLDCVRKLQETHEIEIAVINACIKKLSDQMDVLERENKQTGEYVSFHHWADSADEVLVKISESFLDNPNLYNCSVDEDGTIVVEDKMYLHSEDMKLIKMQKFAYEDFDKMSRIRQEEGMSKYKNL